MEIGKKRLLLQRIHESLAPNAHSAFIIYQITNELRGHAKLFPRAKSEYCLQNIPPNFVTVFFKHPATASNGANGSGGHSHNGNGNGNGSHKH